jgi:hypothetical protein
MPAIPSRSTDIPPPRSPTRSYYSRCSRWPCALFVLYLVPGSQWMRAYDFLLHSMTHAARKNTENRPATRGFQVMAIGVPQQGECVCTCVSSKPLWTSSARHICLRGVLKSCLGLSGYRGFHFCRSLRKKRNGFFSHFFENIFDIDFFFR